MSAQCSTWALKIQKYTNKISSSIYCTWTLHNAYLKWLGLWAEVSILGSENKNCSLYHYALYSCLQWCYYTWNMSRWLLSVFLCPEGAAVSDLTIALCSCNNITGPTLSLKYVSLCSCQVQLCDQAAQHSLQLQSSSLFWGWVIVGCWVTVSLSLIRHCCYGVFSNANFWYAEYTTKKKLKPISKPEQIKTNWSGWWLILSYKGNVLYCVCLKDQ